MGGERLEKQPLATSNARLSALKGGMEYGRIDTGSGPEKTWKRRQAVRRRLDATGETPVQHRDGKHGRDALVTTEGVEKSRLRREEF